MFETSQSTIIEYIIVIYPELQQQYDVYCFAEKCHLLVLLCISNHKQINRWSLEVKIPSF